MDTDGLRELLDHRVAAHEFSGAALGRRGHETLFSYADGVAAPGPSTCDSPRRSG